MTTPAAAKEPSPPPVAALPASRLATFLADWGIWLLAFGYFACYVPYSALTKSLSSGLTPALAGRRMAGASLLPLSVFASVLATATFLSVARWWRYASQARVGRVTLPRPGLWTLLSGLCASVILVTTTLAYTFDGLSIVFMMLLMRGGVLVLAPVVDGISGRRVRWYSWAALALSLAALAAAFEGGGWAMTTAGALDIAFYLAAYFARLRMMTHFAKSDDERVKRRYFVEEQLVTAPASLLILGLLALVGPGAIAAPLREGFAEVPVSAVALQVFLLGVLSQGTGLFGGLVFLDKRENTFTVPVNRSASILAGLCAAYGLHHVYGTNGPQSGELLGAALVIGAILFLTIPPTLEKKRRA